MLTIRLIAVLTCLLASFYTVVSQRDWERDTCDFGCTDSPQPICATNGFDIRTFRNHCIMTTVNCQTNQRWRKIRDRPCCPPGNPASYLDDDFEYNY
ncbi:extracellular protease inhibitor 10 [Nilaparvata lugens]|uniref:extracellular protease inhibitor 10 n=1 Tax=Nilaparvata lugens TaxID=108931 RepID=UPI00193D690B|nr:extracellular protease inhibitor 10 [Nilaparvata lugens]